jgi:flavin-dependent dehydrogenase
MSGEAFDCIVVGARCAGAPLATHLARAGVRVCVVDAAKLPSDQPFSTHAIQPAGMDLLDELGVGKKVRAVAPPVHVNRFWVGGAVMDIQMSPGREIYCPRRSVLDPMLAEAAVSAGAELRDETALLDLLRDGDRVVGARVRGRHGTTELRAPLVVGADGRHSTVAKRAGAEEYLGVDTQRGGYWAYFPTTAAIEQLPCQAYIEINGPDARFLFRTDGDLVISGALAPVDVARTWTRDIEKHVRDSLARSELLRPCLDRNPAASEFTGLRKLRCFFRVPVGPGWALVGDAGLHKDPTPGYGITDALRDAKALAAAIVDGREAALEMYWRERDVKSLPLYMNANTMGALAYDNPFNRLFVAKLGSPAMAPVVEGIVERTISPYEAVPPWRAIAWTAGGLLAGHTDLWKPFLESGKQGTWVNQELARRKALLEAARRRLAAA